MKKSLGFYCSDCGSDTQKTCSVAKVDYCNECLSTNMVERFSYNTSECACKENVCYGVVPDSCEFKVKHDLRVKMLADSMRHTKQSIVNSAVDKVASMLGSKLAKSRLKNNPILKDIAKELGFNYER